MVKKILLCYINNLDSVSVKEEKCNDLRLDIGKLTSTGIIEIDM